MNRNILLRNAAIVLLGIIPLLLSSILNAQVYKKNDVNNRPQNQDEILKIVKSGEKELILEIDIPPFEVIDRTENGQKYQIISIPGFGLTPEPGNPQLPVKGFLFGMPINAQTSLEILDVDYVTQPGYFIYPAPKTVFQQDMPDSTNSLNNTTIKNEFFINQNLYNSNQYYPAEVVKIGEPGFIRDHHVGRLQICPVQFNPVTKEIRAYKKIRLKINFSQNEQLFQPAKVSSQTSTVYDKLLSQSLINYPVAQSWQKKRVPASQIQSQQTQYNISQQGEWYKISIKEDGIYDLTKTALENAGLNLNGVDPRKIKIYHKGQEIAIYVRGEYDGIFNDDDYIEFYGKKINSDFTNTNLYWLNVGLTDGLRMEIKNGGLSGSPPVLTRSKESIHFEENNTYEIGIPNGEGEDHWFWSYIVAENTMNFNAEIDNVSNISASDCSLKVEFRGYSYNTVFPDHHTLLSLNGNQLADDKWDGQVKFLAGANFSQSLLINGNNTVTVQLPGDTEASLDIVYVNWFEIEYWRDYVATEDILSFWGEGNGVYHFQVKNFLQNNIRLYDISDPNHVKRIANLTPVLDGTKYTLKFQDEINGKNRYIALRPNKKKQPDAIIKDEPSQLQTNANQADYLVITHEEFSDRLGALVYHRESQGLKTLTVKIDDVYDEFNYGIKNPKAIKDFLSYAYHNWQAPAPIYVLLVGDASYDYKDNLQTGNVDYVPTHLFESSTYHTETSSDNWFVCVSGEDVLPDMLIGRLPVRTTTEAENIIDKIVNYEENPAQDNWNKSALFVADNEDAGGAFESLSDYLVTTYLPTNFTKNKVYMRDYSTGEAANAAILSKINQGCLVVNYMGHGSTDTWASEKMFVSEDVANLMNSNKFPLVVTMSCLNGYFHHGKEPYSLSEEFLRANYKGSIACFSPSGFGYTSADKILGDGLYQALFRDYDHILGSAIVKSKLNVFAAGNAYKDHIEFFHLLGDPASQISLPAYNINLEKDWNLISFPRQAPDPSVQAVLAPIAENWLQIMTYADGEWRAAESSSDPSFWTLKELDLEKGYWIQMKEPAQLPVYGAEKSVAIPLSKNWNLIGYPTNNELTIKNALSSIDDNWLKILSFSEDKWIGADNELAYVYWTLKKMQSGTGFWLQMSQPDTLEISRIPMSETPFLASNPGNENNVLSTDQERSELGVISGKSALNNDAGTDSLFDTSPPLPSGFYGQIQIDNQPAPVGTEMIAWINRTNWSTNFKINKTGQYGYLLVDGDISSTPEIEGGVQGDTVVFKIITLNHDTLISDIATWETGVIQRHDFAFNAGVIQASEIVIELRINDKIFGTEILASDPVPGRPIFSINFTGGENGINAQSIKLLLNNQIINDNQYIYSSNNEGPVSKGTLIYQPEKLPDGQYVLRIEVMDHAMTPNIASAEFAFWINSELRFEKVVNFPNPMQSDTKFTYNLVNDNPVRVSIKIYTVAGRLIKSIDAASGDVGYNETSWDGRDDFGDEIANGVYFYKIIAKDGNKKAEVIERLVVMK